jgi:hypothetical protein
VLQCLSQPIGIYLFGPCLGFSLLDFFINIYSVSYLLWSNCDRVKFCNIGDKFNFCNARFYIFDRWDFESFASSVVRHGNTFMFV